MKRITHFSLGLMMAMMLIAPVTILNAQTITKPIGCFAGTNGINAAAMAHTESRGVLLAEKWKDIEVSPGNFDFSSLNSRISSVKGAGLKYALAVPGGCIWQP